MNDIHDENLKKNNVRTGSSQEYLDIAEIKNDTVILNNGSMRAVVMCSSMNFALKSSQEQEGVVYGYQQFLNSLDFPIQFVVNSRMIDLSEYLMFLDDKYRVQENELMKIQLIEYKEFIKGLVEVSNIMDKKFYIVIPFTIGEAKNSGNIFDKVAKLINPKKNVVENEADFENYHQQLFQRVSHVISGLSNMGVKGMSLNTQELIELYYTWYNPTAIVGQGGLKDLEKLDIEHGLNVN